MAAGKPERASYDIAVISEVGADYRSGVLSLREIAGRYGLRSENQVRFWAKKYGWVRDLSQRVRQEARARLASGVATHSADRAPEPVSAAKDESAGTATGPGAKRYDYTSHRPKPPALPDEETIIARGADDQVGVIRYHQRLCRRTERACEAVLGIVERELHIANPDEQVPGPATYDMATVFGKNGSIVGALSYLSSSIARLVPLERQAHGIDGAPDEGTYEERLKRLYDLSGVGTPDPIPAPDGDNEPE